jgi:hypothetical protein
MHSMAQLVERLAARSARLMEKEETKFFAARATATGPKRRPRKDARTAASAAARVTKRQGTPGDGAPADKRLCGSDIVDLVNA